MRFHAVVLPLIAVATREAVSPVAKVVELLQAMEGKLKAEGESEADLYEKFVQWSLKEQSDTRATIKESTQTVSDCEAYISDQKAFREKLTAETADVIAEIASLEKELTDATDVRKAEREKFEQEDKERAIALRQLGLAIDTLEKQPKSFLQQNMLDKLKESALVTERNTEVSLLLARAGSKDEILELLRNLEDSTSKDRDDGLAAEQDAQRAFELLEQGLKTQLESANELKADKQRETSASEEASAQKQQEMDTANKVLTETKKYKSDLMVEFKSKTAEHKESMALRSDELTAIQEAVAILTSARAMAVFNSDLQVKMPAVAKATLRLPDAVGPVSLVQVQASVGSGGPFDKVKTMVQDMIGKLEKEAAEAADHHSFCTEERGKTKKSLEKKGAEVTKLGGRLEARQASISEMTTRKAEITEELSNLKTALSDATLLRQEEKANSVKMISEYGDAVKIIESAMNVLNEVFAEKATAGNTIIGILEVAQSDFSKLLAEAQAQESAAEADYKKMSSEAKVREAALSTEMEGVTRMTLETQSDEQHLTRELDSVQKEVEAVQSYLEQLKPQCTVKTPSHEERAARRGKEIEGLQNALGALSGEAIA
jgi:chromosome segregation ATPase